MSLVLQSSGGGSVSIVEPATASNFTQTLPASTGTVMVSGNMPSFSVSCSTNQSIANATATKIQLNTEAFDTNSNFDSTTNYRFTPTVAGYYQINASVYNGNNGGTGTQLIAIYKNGSPYKYTFGPYTNGGSMGIFDIVSLNGSTDYIEIYYIQSSGATQLITGGALYTWCSGSLVRGA